MRPEKLSIVILTVIVMAEGVKTSNIGYPCSPASTSPKVQADSNSDVSPSITEDAETASRVTQTNGNTPPSSSQEAQSDSTTDVSPSTSETIENAPRCNVFIADVKTYSMAKTACREIGGKMFGYEHLQPQKTAQETLRDLMSTYDETSLCNWVWVDIIRNDENQFEWSDGPDIADSDSWWATNQPNDRGSWEKCVESSRRDNWKLHDVTCDLKFCTVCVDALCNSG